MKNSASPARRVLHAVRRGLDQQGCTNPDKACVRVSSRRASACSPVSQCLAHRLRPRRSCPMATPIVTGFSGPAIAGPHFSPGTDPARRPQSISTRPSLRVIDLQAPGSAPQAQLLTTTKPFAVTAGQTGQAFRSCARQYFAAQHLCCGDVRLRLADRRRERSAPDAGRARRAIHAGPVRARTERPGIDLAH